MRPIIFLALILFLAAGVVFGALNPGEVGYDFGSVSFRVPKGAAVLAVLVIGWLLGGVTAWAGMRQRARTRRPRSRRRDRAKKHAGEGA